MRTNRVTAAEVAARAGVSQPTVSRVYTPGSNVSQDKKDRVLAVASELGYMPNTLARSLNTGRSHTIGVVVPYLKNPFYAEALQNLSKALRIHGYHVLVFFAFNKDEEIDRVVEDLLAHQVDGIILASVSLSNKLTNRLQDVGIPFVLFNRGQTGRKQMAAVTASNQEGGRIAARFLAAAGHQRIAHISGWMKSLNGRERQQGFIAGLAEVGLEPWQCVDCHYRRTMAIDATRAFFASSKTPDAIFVGNDYMAFAVLETLRVELGVRVPEDVSVIGFDDVEMAGWATYDLTTLRQPAHRMVDATVELLLGMIDEQTPPRCIEIESDLIIRGSARVPPDWKQ